MYMDLLRVLNELRPRESLGFDNGVLETLSNVSWFSQTTYTPTQYENLEDTSNLIYNEEANLYTVAPFTIPTEKECQEYWDETLERAITMTNLRRKRDRHLAESDKFATVDYPYATEEVKQAYVEYRQALRDLPANTEDPESPTWPEAPKTTPPGPMDILRRKRNEMLRKTDHLAFPDYPHLSDQVRADWMTYRQALRDLPQTAAGDPENAAWPSEPTYQ